MTWTFPPGIEIYLFCVRAGEEPQKGFELAVQDQGSDKFDVQNCWLVVVHGAVVAFWCEALEERGCETTGVVYGTPARLAFSGYVSTQLVSEERVYTSSISYYTVFDHCLSISMNGGRYFLGNVVGQDRLVQVWGFEDGGVLFALALDVFFQSLYENTEEVTDFVDLLAGPGFEV